jgi:hypothetical protein
VKIHARRTTAAIAGAGAALALTVAMAPQALANSFNHQTAAGGYGYDDGADRFCVVAHPGRSISATLTPDNATRGPKRSLSASNGGSDCASLATAYEDSGYTARVSGTSSIMESVHFFS